jgi:type IV secretory pathway VirB9-like protein
MSARASRQRSVNKRLAQEYDVSRTNSENASDCELPDSILKLQERKDASRIAELSPNAAESMNFNYEIKGDAAIRPLMVFDDGAKTFIRMNPEAKHQETPILVVIGSDGKTEMVNYRVKNDLYIADRLFDRARLVLGTGKKALKVEIRRDKPGK